MTRQNKKMYVFDQTSWLQWRSRRPVPWPGLPVTSGGGSRWGPGGQRILPGTLPAACWTKRQCPTLGTQRRPSGQQMPARKVISN